MSKLEICNYTFKQLSSVDTGAQGFMNNDVHCYCISSFFEKTVFLTEKF